MPLSGEARNAQGDAITRGIKPTPLEWATIASQTTVTPELATAAKGRIITRAAHGLNTGDIVVFTEVNANTTFGAQVAGVILGLPYYVRKVSASEFEIANTKTQAESATVGEHVEFSEELKTTSKLQHVIEHTGAKTKRKQLTFAAAANGSNEASAAVEIEATSTVKVKWIMFFTAETSGTFMGCTEVTEKELAAEDLYKITKTVIEQNAVLL